jgi:quinol-cytochrome oxidoreductase complex cytochrome b subunit
MKEFKRKIFAWFDHRTGLESAIRNFLYEDIPGSSGWHQVFGSVAVFLLMVQAFTGVLLAFNYAPTPGDAYNSLKYIITEVAGGRLIHGLHHWGASMMIVVVAVHMTQVFMFGGYKKPREATWMVGVVLLLVTLAFGLTGYLLPWDNRAYWGTVVSTQIASQAPLLGPYLKRLLGTDGSVGVVTFARFYALHVLILPPLITSLIVFHIYLVRKHGVAPAPVEAGPTKKFFPEQMLKDVIAVFAAFVILYVMALFVAVPLERLADPTDLSYVPRPDWYFLFLFQTLKFFKGSMEPVGSVLLPSLGVLALFLIPFLDRGKLVKLTQRTTAIGVVALAAVAWGTLTLAAIKTTPPAHEEQASNMPQGAASNQFSPQELAGLGYFRQEKCLACHNLNDGPPKAGPNLATAREHKNAEWMIRHFKNPNQVVPGSNMPPILLSDANLNTLASFLLKLTPENANDVASIPDNLVRGAQIYDAQGCGNCHMINGAGAKLGPPLNGLSQRRTRPWVEKHFANPAAMSPGSIMPPSKFSTAEMQAIVDYLLSLQGS